MKCRIITINKIVLILSLCFMLTKSEKLKQLESVRSPIIVPTLSSKIHNTQQVYVNRPLSVSTCGCESLVRCSPCGLAVEIRVVECPCAPKPKCPVCPPLSLIHEMAAKKVSNILI